MEVDLHHRLVADGRIATVHSHDTQFVWFENRLV